MHRPLDLCSAATIVDFCPAVVDAVTLLGRLALASQDRNYCRSSLDARICLFILGLPLLAIASIMLLFLLARKRFVLIRLFIWFFSGPYLFTMVVLELGGQDYRQIGFGAPCGTHSLGLPL
ncbi:hypothetical protein B0H11DRAFT_475021 [Mycena galericulata]|nr:hypothetical protein B0H11DRAFT_475021 [Mycena galericulata]